jgi:putative endonuclease
MPIFINMTNKINLGKRGEEMAANWLINQGYQIIERNLRLGNQEIDLIAKKLKLIIFFEIKTGNYTKHDLPLKASQQKNLKKAHEKYCQKYQVSPEITRFDLIIIIPKEGIASLEHFKNLGV